MHAKLHLLQCFCLIGVSLFLWRQDEIVGLGLCFSEIIFEGGLEHIQMVFNFLVDSVHDLFGDVGALFSLCRKLLELKISGDPLSELLL